MKRLTIGKICDIMYAQNTRRGETRRARRVMKKPRLEDYDLTEDLVALNKRQYDLYWKKIDECLAHRKYVRKVILIISLVVTGFIFVINIADNFETDPAGFTMGICFAWDVMYGLYFSKKSDESRFNLRDEVKDKIKAETIDSNVDDAIEKYNKAVEDYEEKAYFINKYSLVKVEVLAPLETSLGERWIVFSNIHLSNSRSFPDIDVPNEFDAEFEAYYNQLTERQLNIIPKPKKHLNITGKMEFYYPCSDIFLAMQGKRAGEIAELGIGVRYKIITVINLDVE